MRRSVLVLVLCSIPTGAFAQGFRAGWIPHFRNDGLQKRIGLFDGGSVSSMNRVFLKDEVGKKGEHHQHNSHYRRVPERQTNAN